MTGLARWWAVSALLLAAMALLGGEMELAGWLSVGSAVGVLAGGLCNRRRARRHGHR